MVRGLGDGGRLHSALDLTDAELLERFVVGRDDVAFEAILHRHGPLVFGVCRRLLNGVHDAEDAFQATFLVLARRAGHIGRPSFLGNWLYGVAVRVAARARKTAVRRQMTERPDGDLTAAACFDTPADPDVAPVLHEEVGRLPDKYRAPVVLCYLEGKTNEEAAGRLQWPVGTVKTRLDKAREVLRTRLARRGIALTAGLLAGSPLSAAVPAGLLGGTFQAAMAFAAGHVAGQGAISASVLTLSNGVLRAMFLTKLKVVTAAVLAVAVVAGAGGVAWYGTAAEPPAKAGKPKEDKDAIVGTWKVVKVEEDGKDASDGEHGKVFRSGPLTIAGEKIVLEGVFEMTYRLDSSAKPKAIDLDNGVGKTFDCVYTLDGDMLTICAPMSPGGDRPKEVASKEGSQTRVLVLKREGK
jgi:RNA polymerase sigma factor (sigma-70 family)